MSSAWILAVPVAVIAALWMRDRRQVAAALHALSLQQQKTDRVLNEFIEESGKIMREFSRLLPSSAPAPVVEASVETPAEPKPDRVEKRHMVWRLAQKGHNAVDIADRLMMPVGEVHLILNLDPGKRKKISA